MLWIIIALMTAAAVLAVLWPLARRQAVRGGSDRLIYQDQLQEVERDRAAGMIGESEAETARIEISRRLIAAADAESQAANGPTASQATWHRRIAALTVIVVVPAVALGLYVRLGSPGVPDQSAFTRGNPQGGQSVAELVSQVEAHLAQSPNDGTGWQLLAGVYMDLGRYDDAVVARRKSIVLNGDTPTREADLGEAVVAAANGVVTTEAKQIFQKAVAADPHNAQARYFLGLADEQDGNPTVAAAKWRALLDEAPPGAPWANFVRQQLARVGGAAAPSPMATNPALPAPDGAARPAANGPTADDVAAAQNMTEAQRSDMVRGMVQRLAERLHTDGDDVQGWLRLVRAYVVLGDRDRAKGAADDARRALSAHPDEIKQIDDLVKNLGLES